MKDKLPVRFTGPDDFEFAGEKFSRTGIGIVHPNPQSPGKLIGIVTLPFDEASIDRFFEFANLGFRAYRGVDESAVECMIMPDILIYQSLSANSRAWCFDRLWEHPSEIK